MSSKDRILGSLRARSQQGPELPDLRNRPWVTFDDPRMAFVETLESVGGESLSISDPNQLGALLRERLGCHEANSVYSAIPELEGCDSVPEGPHDCSQFSAAVVSAQFAVAENGAVWVSDEQLPHRAILFLVEQLILVVPAAEVVHNMHEAYARLSFERSGFGVFISGPSKTADIEQSLVIGAQGSKQHTVVLIEP